MIFTKSKIDGVIIVTLKPKTDERGYFQRIYDAAEFKKQEISLGIVQINQSMSVSKGTIRGLHMQKSPKPEDKLIQCIKGSIFDVVIDLRSRSKTYGQWLGKVLEANKEMIFVPKGCAHGFQALENNTIVQYSTSEYYSPEYETGIRWNDPFFGIEWPLKKAIVSEKDSSWSDFVT